MLTESDRNIVQELDDAIQSVMDKTMTAQMSGSIFHCIISSTETILIQKALYIAKGDQIKASSLLGITLNTLTKKMQEYKIFSE